MLKANLKAGSFLIVAFLLVAASILCRASDSFGQETVDLSKWSESSSREAGTRQMLRVGKVEIGLVWIPAGEFEMGSPDSESGRCYDEKRHKVRLTKGFWMLETEATQTLYKEVMGTNPSRFIGDDFPVEEVSWRDAMDFCEALTERLPEGIKATLPTEAQWEYACRAGTTTPFSFGDALNGDKANCDGGWPYGTLTGGKYLKKTTPVKSYGANLWGLYDMHGNVWEWTSDCYARDYPSGTETVIDPKGPDDASDRVSRGGGWINFSRNCRSAYRHRNSPDYRISNLGFRFILSCD